VVFEPTIPVSERPQTHALDRAATGTGKDHLANLIYKYSRIILTSIFPNLGVVI